MLEHFYTGQVELIQGLQHMFGLHWLWFFRGLSYLGEEPFYLLLLPLIYWCVDYRLGARLTIIFLVTVWLNVILKDLLGQPRPFEFEPTIKLGVADGYGLPSGHAQLGLVFWGLLAWGLGQRKKVATGVPEAGQAAVKTSGGAAIWAGAMLLVGLIGLSRLYLGVHFPTDLLGGWLVAGLVMGLYFATRKPLERTLFALPLAGQLLLALAVPLLLLLVYVTKETAIPLPTLAGGASGLVLIQRSGGFDPGGGLMRRGWRYLGGLLVFGLIYLGLRVVLPSEGEAGYLAGRAVRYGLLGLWVSYGAPQAFIRLGLLK